MKGGDNVNGTGMAVLIGVVLILASFFTPVDFLSRVGLFAFGAVCFGLGLVASKN